MPLGDGTFGLLPEEWLAKYAPLAAVAKTEEDTLRFTKTQVGLLDALLATQPDSTFDETFQRTRDELMRFEGLNVGDAPVGFVGELRHYQRETLGWFEFLRKFGFGGCLADDMGLGKTVQVLALLESRRANPERRGPTLVVVPRSLVFNWNAEASRFAPQLRVLDHSGINRGKGISSFKGYDLILTTYGTLRRDAIQLKEVRFDYVVLDEAQAIKNPNSESAKAARLLQADHRLVLSGTPVQNHLGDLWSLFEFLNPGMLGAVSAFSAATLAGGGTDADGRAMLARGLRPFILRRTKEQVAPELPARMEQTLYCELETEQRKLYDELREHYRHSLLGLIDREGIGKAKIQILEALLRLRQAACHPGLIDKTRDADSSAKLDTLIPRLLEVTEDGHKALIFSQFTQFLAIVRKKLDKEGLVYEYLDGRTRDRQQRVDRFQTDPNCKLFLISLKAGGLGLNLTAADYVFLLDPWWNPAVEAQAIDRSHRIGQTRQVFACRLIARETVEEKVLALQQSKRSLADAIINGDNSLLRSIGRGRSAIAAVVSRVSERFGVVRQRRDVPLWRMQLAAVDFQDPLLWAVLIGWILSVVLHEFAHGFVAYLGGDYTIRERGGLTLNPLQYIDPVFSLLIPLVIFMLGGIPLPGGVTYVRRDLLRNRAWQVAVSLAGPAMNFLIFIALVLPFHPTIGWIDASALARRDNLSNGILFVGAMAWLQMLSVLINLVPIPPLDGFQAIAQLLPEQTRHSLQTPAVRQGLFLLFFIVLSTPVVFQRFHNGVINVLTVMRFDRPTIAFFASCYSQALFH